MNRQISLKLLMVLIIISLIMLPLTVVSFIEYRNSSKNTIHQYTDETTIIARDLKRSAEKQLQEAENTVKVLSSDPEILSKNPERQKALLEKIVKIQPAFELLYVTDEKGMQTARSSGTNGDRSDRDWFKAAKQGQTFFSGSYISKSTNQPTVTIAMPVKDANGQIIGTIGADLSLKYIQSLVEDVKVGDSGYAFITDQKGLPIAHQKQKFEEYVLKQVDLSKTYSVAKGLQGGSETEIWEDSEGVKQYGTFLPISTLDAKSPWVITVQVPYDEVMSSVNKGLLLSLSISGGLALLAGILTFLFASILVKPISHITEVMVKASQGDLTSSVSFRNRIREFEQLKTSINKMIESLRGILLTTQQNAKDVSHASTELSAGSRLIAEGATQIAATMEELSAGNENQTQQVEVAANQMESLRHEINGINKKFSEVRDLAEALNEESISSMEGVNKATKQLDAISEVVNTSAQQINLLEAKSQQIEQMITLITDIAQQTNLLALNAAIEAARAGDAGRGFAVVADEVRKLAEQSGEAADQITRIISEIRFETHRAVEAMSTGNAEAEKGASIVRNTLTSLERIANSIQDIVKNTREVAEATDRMNQSTEDVFKVVTNLAAISEESSAATEEVTASVTEQTSTINDLAKSAHKLSDLSVELEKIVSKFKL